jgi:hypothetical protein
LYNIRASGNVSNRVGLPPEAATATCRRERDFAKAPARVRTTGSTTPRRKTLAGKAPSLPRGCRVKQSQFGETPAGIPGVNCAKQTQSRRGTSVRNRANPRRTGYPIIPLCHHSSVPRRRRLYKRTQFGDSWRERRSIVQNEPNFGRWPAGPRKQLNKRSQFGPDRRDGRGGNRAKQSQFSLEQNERQVP